MNGGFCRFGLIVTGTGERAFLPELFSCLCRYANCHTKVIRKTGQKSPITSQKKILHMTGTGKIIPDKDAEEIGLPARRFLTENAHNFVVLIDDLEHDRQPIAAEVFARYRLAFDTMLTSRELRSRAAVHFLVNMLEAYYFAHCIAVNSVAGVEILANDHPTDVEQINHPKSQLKRLWDTFDEVTHGERIVQALDVEHVLARPKECCWLRLMFKWCVDKLTAAGVVYDPNLSNIRHARIEPRFVKRRHLWLYFRHFSL